MAQFYYMLLSQDLFHKSNTDANELFLSERFTLAKEDTCQDDHFDVIVCVFGHLSATSFAC